MNKFSFYSLALTLAFLLCNSSLTYGQNVGIGTTTPQGKLHVKGNADTSQLVISANATQSNSQPLIRLRNAAGVDLMHIHTDDSSNIFIGKNAGRLNAFSGTSGWMNTFVGLSAGSANSDGFKNVAIGSSSFKKNSSGYQNVAIGSLALANNTGGAFNVAIGESALYLNSTGDFNVAVGQAALYNSTTGGDNTAVGTGSLFANNSGGQNTALGSSALRSNIMGSDNTAIGNVALNFNRSNYNTAIGSRSLYFNTDGIQNTAIGYGALYTNATGSNNTALGFQADNSSSNLSNNTMIGYGAHVTNANGCTAIGYNASTMNTNNLIVLGNPSTVLTGGYTSWTNFSDGRFKKMIREDVKGLEFVLRLRPVTYNMDVKGLYNFWQLSPYGSEQQANAASIAFIDESIKQKESIRMSGFIAQEVEKAANQSGYEFDGVVKPQNEKDHYRLAYSEFVVPLVKAVQEQQKMIAELKAENTNFQMQMNEQQKITASLQLQIAELKALIKK